MVQAGTGQEHPRAPIPLPRSRTPATLEYLSSGHSGQATSQALTGTGEAACLGHDWQHLTPARSPCRSHGFFVWGSGEDLGEAPRAPSEQGSRTALPPPQAGYGQSASRSQSLPGAVALIRGERSFASPPPAKPPPSLGCSLLLPKACLGWVGVGEVAQGSLWSRRERPGSKRLDKRAA